MRERTFSIRSDKFVFLAIIMISFASTIWISSVSALPQQQTLVGVKITNPAKGQQLVIGKNLTLSGTSSYNSTSIPSNLISCNYKDVVTARVRVFELTNLC